MSLSTQVGISLWYLPSPETNVTSVGKMANVPNALNGVNAWADPQGRLRDCYILLLSLPPL